MHIVRYQTSDGTVVGVDDTGTLRRLPVGSMAELLTLRLDQFRELALTGREETERPARFLAPVDGLTEVWAAGVTYQRSRAARVEESRVADVYDLVYEAPRPELFFKSVAWRVVGHGDPVGVRVDSELNVPEPELALAINAYGEVIGATICNDVSSRSIEGANPLYLPQAKVYAGACALGPGIRPIWELNLDALPITANVIRGGQTVWQGETSTAAMHRSFADLVEHLFRAERFPHGAVLSTGTGIVPELSFTLARGDVVSIVISGVGELSNTVQVGTDAFAWIPVPGLGGTR